MAASRKQRAAGEAVDVLVIGGGFTGLTLAAALAQAGLEAAVVDRETPEALCDAGFDGRSSALAHGSQQLLSALGVWRHLADVAEPIREIRVADGDSHLFLHYDARELTGDGDAPRFGYMVENRDIRRALFRHLAASPGARLLSNVTVAELAPGPRGVAATLSDGRRLDAALAVAADGRNSPTRRAAGIPATQWSYLQTGIVCTVAHDRPHRGVAVERFLPAGPFAILPLPGRRSAIVWTESARRAPAILALDEAGFLAELRRRFGDFLGAIRVVGRRWSYPLGLVCAQRYVGQRLALVGDAAHAIHPIAGQGLNLGLRDVAALAEVVADARRLGLDPGDAMVLERYQRWRRFDAVVLMAVTDGLNRLFSNDMAPLRLARDLGLAAVDRLPGLKRVFARHAMGTVGKLPRLLRGLPL